MMKNNRLLIIDDEAGSRDFLRRVAENRGFDVIAARTPEEFFAANLAFSPTLVIIDLSMSRIDGLEIIRYLAKRSSKAQISVLGGTDPETPKLARRLGAAYGLSMLDPLKKPISLQELERLLEKGRILGNALVHSDPGGKVQFASRVDIERGIENGEFIVFYQPKVSLEGTRNAPLVGAEALVRWQHPQFGLIAPQHFIPRVERCGLIAPLTDLVLGQAIRKLSSWQKSGFDLSLSVNLAPELLTEFELPDRLSTSLRAVGIPANRLILEITERAITADSPVTADALTRFRLKDVRLSLDDVGVGCSSWVDLYRLPFSELKIDQSFIGDLDKSEDARVIVRALTKLAQNLDLSVCAEGVENVEALNYLDSIGCQQAQGYLFSKPLPPDVFEGFVASGDLGNAHHPWIMEAKA